MPSSQLSPRPDAARIDLIFRDASLSAEPPNHPMGWRQQSPRWRADPSGPPASIVLGSQQRSRRQRPILRVQIQVRILRQCPVKLRADDRYLVGVVRLPKARQLLGSILGQVLNGL